MNTPRWIHVCELASSGPLRRLDKDSCESSTHHFTLEWKRNSSPASSELVKSPSSEINVCVCECVLPLGLNCMQDMGLSWAGKWATTPSPSDSSLTKTWSKYTHTQKHTETLFQTIRTFNPKWDFPLPKDLSSHFSLFWYPHHTQQCSLTSPFGEIAES